VSILLIILVYVLALLNKEYYFLTAFRMSKIYAFSAETTTTKLAPVCFAMGVACGIEILREHMFNP